MLDIQRRERPEHPQTLQTISLLASTLEHEGRYDEAGKLLRDMLEIQRRVLGTDNPTTSLTIYNLACDAARSGDPLDALALLNEAVDRQLPVDVLLGFDKDAGLKSLHGDPNFTAVVARARLKAATVQHSK
jgi:hypothetical protein